MELPHMEEDNISLDDPTQIIPSSLYSLDMFSHPVARTMLKKEMMNLVNTVKLVQMSSQHHRVL
jgi:hypothetical protein